MLWIFVVWALIAGVLFPLQSGINSQLGVLVGDPGRGALVSFTVGFIVLLIYSFTIRKSWPPVSRLVRAPWWIWTGGLYGTVIVATAIILAPRLGAALFISLLVTGQMAGALIFDHFGVVGFETRPINLVRVMGTLMLIGGVFLIRRF
jgi:transporter family-2 protein